MCKGQQLRYKRACFMSTARVLRYTNEQLRYNGAVRTYIFASPDHAAGFAR